jgi:hypothetical protein
MAWFGGLDNQDNLDRQEGNTKTKGQPMGEAVY